MSGSQILQPSVSVTLANATRTVQNTDQRVLIVGQMLTGGSATSEDLQENISSSGAPENALFGQSSQIAEMIRAFKRINEIVRVDAIGIEDHASGVPRVVDFTVAGTAAAGTITVTVGSEILYEFEVAVAVGDTVTDIADAITAAINANGDCGFTCSNIAGAVTLTADNDGTVANDCGIGVVLSSGVGITVAAVTETTPGSQDPVLTTILDNATGRYQTIVWPWSDTSVLRTFLDARFNVTNAVMDGVGIVVVQDTHANHLTALGSLNTQSLVFFAEKTEGETLYLGPSQNEASYVKSAYFAAIRSLRLTEDASISHLLTSSASLDQFGGPALASLPYFNTPMANLPVIAAGRGWTNTEIEQLFDAGGAVIGVNRTGSSALIGEVVTTYLTDAAANPDPTFKFLNYVDTGSQIREYFANNLRARFAQSRLTEGAVSRGRDMANEGVIRAYCEQLYQTLAGPSYVLVQDGEEAIVFFKTNLVVTLALATGTVTITARCLIVTQLRTIIATVNIDFSTEG